jgi:hypothetical protein
LYHPSFGGLTPSVASFAKPDSLGTSKYVEHSPNKKHQAITVVASSNDQHVKQLAEIIQQLCAEIDRVEKIGNDAYSETRRAKRIQMNRGLFAGK